MLSTRYSGRILMKLGFSRQIFEKKKAQISSFIKVRSLGAELFHADSGQTDIVAFRNFANAPKNARYWTSHSVSFLEGYFSFLCKGI